MQSVWLACFTEGKAMSLHTAFEVTRYKGTPKAAGVRTAEPTAALAPFGLFPANMVLKKAAERPKGDAQ